MKTPHPAITTISDADLITRLVQLAGAERTATVELLRSLMEFDARKLYLGEGYPSLFAYCTQMLHYSEHAALNRIEVARAARRFPVLLEQIVEGSLNLTGARLIAPHLTEDDVDKLLAAARHKSKREIEELIAAFKPRPVVASTVRRLPSPDLRSICETNASAEEQRSASSHSVPTVSVVTPTATRALVAPLTPERFKVQFTITRETRDKLRSVQDVMRHIIPNGDPATIFDRALTMLLEDLQRKRYAATTRPHPCESVGPHSRHIPAAVRRRVWQRDGGRCAFVGSHGRCGEQGFLEFHHVVPFAAGGTGSVENIQLRCRAHNAYEASLFFGSDGAHFVREVATAYLGYANALHQLRIGK